MSKAIECQECGTEIMPDDCDCWASHDAHIVGEQTGIALPDCPRCKGTGFTNDYHCSHCWWQKEE